MILFLHIHGSQACVGVASEADHVLTKSPCITRESRRSIPVCTAGSAGIAGDVICGQFQSRTQRRDRHSAVEVCSYAVSISATPAGNGLLLVPADRDKCTVSVTIMSKASNA